MKGTTVDATAEKTEATSRCTPPESPSVWYRLTASRAGRVIVELQADGDLDATIDVFRRVRSQTQYVDCDRGDEKGAAATDFQAVKGGQYLLRVAQQAGSVAGTFTLRVSAPIAPARPPGPPLPAGGVTRSLDRVVNSDDAWAVSFHTGVTYRVHLSGRGGCSTSLRVYRPGISSFADAGPARTLRCGGYWLFTPEPGEGGRYSLRVVASRFTRGAQGYHLQVARAGRDDTAPDGSSATTPASAAACAAAASTWSTSTAST